MERHRRIGVLVTATTLVAVALLLAPATSAGPEGRSRLRANLSGAAVVPGPGDPDATGRAELRLLPEKKKICFIFTHESLAPDDPVLGEVHRAPEGVSGPTVVTLFEGIPGMKSSAIGKCAKTKGSVLKDLARHPERFYVDLHTPLFPDGAIRGQLYKKPPPG